MVALKYAILAAIRDWTSCTNVRVGDNWDNIRLTWYGREYEITITRRDG